MWTDQDDSHQIHVFRAKRRHTHHVGDTITSPLEGSTPEGALGGVGRPDAVVSRVHLVAQDTYLWCKYYEVVARIRQDIRYSSNAIKAVAAGLVGRIAPRRRGFFFGGNEESACMLRSDHHSFLVSLRYL